jgi:hypothetical protein
VRFADFTLSIGERQPNGYSVSAVASALGRVSATLPPPSVALTTALARVTALKPPPPDEFAQAGRLLFDYALPATIRTHLRVAWDRAERAGEGLRLRLSIDAPELAAWPWELLRDAERDVVFAASASTPVLRYYDRADRFGALAELGAEPPIEVLLVLPRSPDLDLRQERRNVEEVAAATDGALRARALDGAVTRSDLADALLLGNYQCVHFGGHGGFIEGKGYLGLNEPDGAPDWLDGEALARLVVNYRATRLVVLNGCNTGQTADAKAFAGLAPQLVRHGVAAVVAMQFPVTDKAAAIFAREFYKRLCVGDEAGQVDVAVAYARSMLAVLRPDDRSWAAPVLFTHAADGVIFTVPARVRAGGALDPLAQRERLLALTASLAISMKAKDDWRLASRAELIAWRQMTEEAGEAYRNHLGHSRPEVRQAAEEGLALLKKRVAAIDAALSEAPARGAGQFQ